MLVGARWVIRLYTAGAAVIQSYLNSIIKKSCRETEKLNDPIMNNRTYNNCMVMELILQGQ